jgi:hypothetical protein
MRQFASLRASAASAQAMMQVAGMPVGADGELWESVAGALPDPAGDCPEVSGPFPAGRSGFRDVGHGSGRDGDRSTDRRTRTRPYG